MAQRFLLSAEKLDELFVQEVASVVKLVFRLPTKDQVMPICVTWLKVFQQATAEELFSRNSLLLLLHKQLNDRGTLDYPFTDPETTQMDLRALHQISLGIQLKDNEDFSVSGEDSQQNELYSLTSCDNNLRTSQELIDTNKAFTQELQALQLQREKLQAKLEQLEEAKKLQSERIARMDKEYCYMKRVFACSSIKAFQFLCTGCDPAELFVTLYNVFCHDESDIRLMKLLGEQFNDLLQAHIEHYQKEQLASLLELAHRKFYELRERANKRYKVMVGMKSDAEEKEIILTAMRNLTVLRKVFITTFKGEERTTRAALNFLELSYEQMAKLLPEKDAGLPGN